VWAIGTGVSASLEQAQEAHKFIKNLASETCKKYINKIKILYGGSVDVENITKFCHLPHIDGVLVGGASLQVSSFLCMIERLSQILL